MDEPRKDSSSIDEEKIKRIHDAFWDAVEKEEAQWTSSEVGGLGLVILQSLMNAAEIPLEEWAANIAVMIHRHLEENELEMPENTTLH